MFGGAGPALSQPRMPADSGASSARGAAEDGFLAEQRLARGRGDLDFDVLAWARQAAEVDHLVVARAAAQPARIGPRRPLDEDLERAADEALRALVSAALDDFHQALHPRHLDLVRDLVGQLGC